MLAGACAALTFLFVPVPAATVAGSAAMAQPLPASANAAVTAFYAWRQGAPLWLRNGPDSPAARDLITALRRSPLDGFASGPALSAQGEGLLARARGGDPAALPAAEQLLSTAWVMYVQALEKPPVAMTFADGWARPRQQSAQEILMRAAAANSLDAHVRSVSSVNPVYAELRDAAWAQMQATGSGPDPRVLASLGRIRAMPFQKRYIIVDAGSARLWMIENGRIVDSMKVIVGKPSAPTPILGSVIYYATLNPYWNVPPNLVQSLTAARVLQQGFGYLKSHGYQVLTKYGDDGEQIDPAKIDWKAIANGQQTVAVRQLPGPANSMGHLKFGFANPQDVYLHDTPEKNLFGEDNRNLSNGCIRLEDAERLGRWLLGRDPTPDSNEPEQHLLLPEPVPIYLTYLTARAEGGQLSFLDDVYGLDRQRPSEVALTR
jgi:murein L,D-transpeptidase YcbB/YkuD